MTFFGLYSLASTSVLFINGCRGGFGGGDLSNFGMEIFTDEWYKLEFVFNKKWLVVEGIGNVDERTFRRLDTLNKQKIS